MAVGSFGTITVAANTNNEITVTIDGQPVLFEGQGPVIIDGRTMVPVRGVFEHLGFEVTWLQEFLMISMERGDDVIVLYIDDNRVFTNDVSHVMDVPPQIIDGRTLVPIRAPLESVGYNVDWDGATRTVIITSGGAPTAGSSNSANQSTAGNTADIIFPNRTPDQARRDIATAVGMDDYLNATISTLWDFHYGDILQLTAAVFIFDGDQSHGQERFLQNWVDMYQPFYDRIPFIVNFERIFYFPNLSAVEHSLNNRGVGARDTEDNSALFLNYLRQLPNFDDIDTIIVMDRSTGSEPNFVELDGKQYYFIHASLQGAYEFTLHGAIHGFQGRYYHETAHTVMNVTRFGRHDSLLVSQAEIDAQAARWRELYPDLPHYSQWDAGSLHMLSRNDIISLDLSSMVGMPTTRQPWSGGNPDHGWSDFRAYTYFEATTQAELDRITSEFPRVALGYIFRDYWHYFVNSTTVAEWDEAHAALVAAGAGRLNLEYFHYLRWAQTSPKSITQEIDPLGNQVGMDVALAKWLRNMRSGVLPDGTRWLDLGLHSRYFTPTFHQLPVRSN